MRNNHFFRMMTKYHSIKLIFLITTVLSTEISLSQIKIREKQLSQEEIDVKTCDFETGTSAIVINDFKDYWFDVNSNGKNMFLFVEQRVRIKILNEEGLKYAKFKIPFHNMHCEELFGENTFTVKGFTYNFDEAGKIKKTKLKRKNIIYRDTTNRITTASVTMPDVTVGSVIEYTIRIPTLEFERPLPAFIQYDIPVLFSETNFDVPRYFEYIFTTDADELITRYEQQDFSRILHHVSQVYVYGRMRNIGENIDMSGQRHRFLAENITSFKPVYGIYAPDTYRKKISFHLKYAQNDNNAIGWKRLTYNLFNTLEEDYDRLTPGQRKMNPYTSAYVTYNLPTWEQLNKKLLKSEKFGLALVKYWNTKPLLDSLFGGEKNDSLKILKIYDYISKDLKWNGIYDIYADVSDNFFKKMYARMGGAVKLNNIGKISEDTAVTSSVKNFAMIYLLKKAGIKTAPVLISTPSHGRVDENIPDIKQFNTSIAEVEIGGKKYYLDAANPQETFFKIPGNTEKRTGFRVDEKDFMLVDYNKPFISK